MKLEISRQIFEKYSNVKFHKNPSSGNRGVPCGWTDTQTYSYMMKLTVNFRNFAKTPKKQNKVAKFDASRIAVFTLS